MVCAVAKVTPPVSTVTIELPPASTIAAGLTDTVNAASSLSVIVTVTGPDPTVAFCGFVRRTRKTSSSSTRWSSRIATVNVFAVSPGAKVSVPLAAV